MRTFEGWAWGKLLFPPIAVSGWNAHADPSYFARDRQYHAYWALISVCLYYSHANKGRATPTTTSMAMKGKQQETMQAAEQTGMNPAVMASAASVVLSWYFFFVKGDKLSGLFVGLWPPTFLAFASHFEQQRMSAKIKQLTPGGGSSGVVKSIERVMQGK